jgi:hypothetical protein
MGNFSQAGELDPLVQLERQERERDRHWWDRRDLQRGRLGHREHVWDQPSDHNSGEGTVVLDAGRATYLFNPHLTVLFHAGPSNYNLTELCAALAP